MDWHSLAPFLTATLLLLIIPGPVVTVVAHNTLRGGAASGVSTVIGVELGRFLALSVTFAGVILSGEFFPSLFRWLSLAGTAYLVWLALSALRRHDPSFRRPVVTFSARPIIEGLAIAFSNPVTLVFYAAFFPQFIKPDRPIAQQAILLGVMFLSTSLVFELVLVFAFARLRQIRSYGLSRLRHFATLSSAVIYMAIAAVAIFRFANYSG